MLKKLFPDLFQPGVESVNYGEVTVKLQNAKGPIISEAAIISAPWPIGFLDELADRKGIDFSEINWKQTWHDTVIVYND